MDRKGRIIINKRTKALVLYLLCSISFFSCSSNLLASITDDELIDSLSQGDVNANIAAKWLGKRESAQGLWLVAQEVDEELIKSYFDGYPWRNLYEQQDFPYLTTDIPTDLESTLVNILLSPKINLEKKRIALKILSERRYVGRQLFDAINSITWVDKLGREDYPAALVVNTELKNIEPLLLARYEELSRYSQSELAKFFQRRGYNDATQTLIKSLQAEGLTVGGSHDILLALAGLNNRIATEFILSSLEEIVDSKNRNELAVNYLLEALFLVEKDVQINSNRLIALSSNFSERNQMGKFIMLLGKRPNILYVDYLMNIYDSSHRQQVSRVLYSMDTPDSWRKIRHGLANLYANKKISEINYRNTDRKYSTRIDNPQAYFNRNVGRMRAEKLQNALAKEYEPYQEKLQSLSNINSDKYEQALEIVEKKQLGILQQFFKQSEYRILVEYEYAKFAKKYLELVNGDRFIDKNPTKAILHIRRALEFYRLAKSRDNYFEILKLNLWLADIYRFDLKDKQAAAIYYEEVLGWADDLKLSKHKFHLENKADLSEALRYWLPHEIHYLKTGKPFSGSINHDQMYFVGQLIVDFGEFMPIFSGIEGHRFLENAHQPNSDESVSIRLGGALRSQFSIMDSVSYLPLVPNAEVLRFLEASDPTHYLSAIIISSYNSYSGTKNYPLSKVANIVSGRLDKIRVNLKTNLVASKFKRRNDIRFVKYGNKKLETPIDVWRKFRSALRDNDSSKLDDLLTVDAKNNADIYMKSIDASYWPTLEDNLLQLEFVRGESKMEYRLWSQSVSNASGHRKTSMTSDLPIEFTSEEGQWKISNIEIFKYMAETYANR